MSGNFMNYRYSKWVIVGVSLLLVGILAVWDTVGNYKICDAFFVEGHFGSCPRWMGDFEVLLFPALPLLIFAMITFFLRDSVFQTWARFAVPATVLSMLAILLTQNSPGGGFGPQLSFGKGDVALITGFLFVIISIVIIVRGYLRPAK